MIQNPILQGILASSVGLDGGYLPIDNIQISLLPYYPEPESEN
jgi:hypothetical protein